MLALLFVPALLAGCAGPPRAIDRTWVASTAHDADGTYMLADLLTKAVSRPIFLQLMELLDAYARTGVSVLHS